MGVMKTGNEYHYYTFNLTDILFLWGYNKKAKHSALVMGSVDNNRWEVTESSLLHFKINESINIRLLVIKLDSFLQSLDWGYNNYPNYLNNGHSLQST